MEYFVVQDLGWDGTAITKYATKEEAERAYQTALADIDLQIKTLSENADKGLALIEGNILNSQYMDKIW